MAVGEIHWAKRVSDSSLTPAILAAITVFCVTTMLQDHPPTWSLAVQLTIVATALSAAIRTRWIRATSFLVLLAAVPFTASAMLLYVPTVVAVVRMMVRNPIPVLDA